MGEKEVCNGCNFYDKEVEGHCKARQELKDRCTYWDNELGKIVPVREEELKAVDRE